MEKKKASKKVVSNSDSKKQLKATIVGVALIVASLGLGVGTYAYYQTTISGNVTGTITAWSFLVNNQLQTFSANLNDLYPGANGPITLNLSAASSGLDVNAVVSFSNKTNWPSNLKLYKDASHQTEIVIGTTTIEEQIPAGESKSVTVYYYWPYGESVETNTYGGQTASVDITVVGTQVNPNN